MKYHPNSWPDWDEYYHEDNSIRSEAEGLRYVRQTRDGKWWYYFSQVNTDWVEMPEVNTLEEAAEVADTLWRMR